MFCPPPCIWEGGAYCLRWLKGEQLPHPLCRAGQPLTSSRSLCSQDAMRSVTKQAIKEARLREIKEELLNSEKLKVRSGRSPQGPIP